jgi:hypothetical protein
MVRFGAEGLATFRAVNAVQANLLATAIVKDCEGIAIGDADDFAGEVLSGDDSGEEEKDGSPTVTPTYRHDAGGDDGLQLK